MTIAVQNLFKQFQGASAPVVCDVSFTGRDGSITTLLGPSGAGKSTILRLIAGLDSPDRGRIDVDGRDFTGAPVQERSVGFVFQNYALFPHMTVRENVGFGLKVRKVPRRDIDARVRDLLRLVQLEALGERYPSQLSGGQRQRVAFARALAIQPRVLLLDEPFGALDTRVRAELREWLQRLHGETGLATIMVTHDQSEALELSQHVVVMDQGRVVQAGSPHEVYDQPASPFVASFVGGANVLSGLVQSGRAEVGSMGVDAPGGAPDGATVRAFVRPHDVKLAKAAPCEGPVTVGRIDRMRRIGGYVRVSLTLASGEKVDVETPRAEIEALNVGEGDDVMVDLRAARMFVEDYAI